LIDQVCHFASTPVFFLPLLLDNPDNLTGLIRFNPAKLAEFQRFYGPILIGTLALEALKHIGIIQVRFAKQIG